MSIFGARETNARRARIRANRIADVVGGKVRRGRFGAILDMRRQPEDYRHPWFCSPLWLPIPDSQDFAWYLEIEPGVVNGFDVAVIEGGRKSTLADGARVRIGGWTPSFAPDALAEIAEDKTVLKSELILQTPRITASQTTAFGELETLDIQTEFNAQIFSASPRYQIFTRAVLDIEPEPDDLDFYLGEAAEPAFDLLKIATIWAIAPDDADGEPDETWSLYPQYHVFWNLQHASRAAFGPEVEPLKVSFDTALAGGIANRTTRQFLQDELDQEERIRAYFEATKSKGEFWT